MPMVSLMASFVEGNAAAIGKCKEKMKLLKSREESVLQGKWLHSKKVFYSFDSSKENCWESVQRTFKHGDVDGIDVLPIVRYSNKPAHVALILNFRPPIHSFCLEFPAGLLDANETPEECALRELREESGLVGVVKKVFKQPLFCDPWKSNESSYLVSVDIDGDATCNMVGATTTKKGIDEESIELLFFPLSELFDQITSLLETNPDFKVDAKLWTLALGMNMNKLLE